MNILVKFTRLALVFGYYRMAMDDVLYVDALQVDQPLDLTSPEQTRKPRFNENIWCPTPGTPLTSRADGVASNLQRSDLVSGYRLDCVLASPGLGASRGRRDVKPCQP